MTDTLSDELREFEDNYIPFPTFEAAMEVIESNLQLFRETGIARHALVLGEAGTGKSSLCRWMRNRHPTIELPDRDKIVVLVVSIPPSATVGGIAEGILRSLNDPHWSKGSVSSKTARICVLIKGCGVELVLFDESQHLQDRGEVRMHYLVADWFKHLIDEINVPTVLLGLPRLEHLLEANDQLRRRFSRRLNLQLGQSTQHSIEMQCLQLFMSLTSLIRLSVDSKPYSPQEMGLRLYYASDGRVAYIKKILFAALQRAREQDLPSIDALLLQQVFKEEIWVHADGRHNPFNPEFEFRRLDRTGEPFQAAGIGGRRKR